MCRRIPLSGTPKEKLEQHQHAGTGTQHVPVCEGVVPPFQPLFSAVLGRTAPQSLLISQNSHSYRQGKLQGVSYSVQMNTLIANNTGVFT